MLKQECTVKSISVLLSIPNCAEILTVVNGGVVSECSTAYQSVTQSECQAYLNTSGVQAVEYKPDEEKCLVANCSEIQYNTPYSMLYTNIRLYRYFCDSGKHN